MTVTEDAKEPSYRLGELLRAGACCDRSGAMWRRTLEFHELNPWVFDRLKQICSDLRERGFTHYSTRTVISVLRFEWDLQSTGQGVVIDGGEERVVKLNDHHSPYYARMLIEQCPEVWWDFFELRAAEGDPAELPKPPEPEWPRFSGPSEQLALF
jgi:hypothetical protein